MLGKTKIALGVGAVALAALALMLFLQLRVEWQPAFNDVDPLTAAQIEYALSEAGIRSSTDLEAGEVRVPVGYLEAAQIAVAASPFTRDDIFTFPMAIEHGGIGISDELRHEMLVREREHEAARILEELEFVASADVRFHIPHENVLDDVPTTATVRVVPTRDMTYEDGEAIALMMTRMIDGLDLDGIVVSDNQLNVVFREHADEEAN